MCLPVGPLRLKELDECSVEVIKLFKKYYVMKSERCFIREKVFQFLELEDLLTSESGVAK